MKLVTLNVLLFRRDDREFAEPVDFRWLVYLFREKRRSIQRSYSSGRQCPGQRV